MPTILEIAQANLDLDGDTFGDFNILGAALSLFPDLANAAGNPAADLTVFAPTDQAFLNLANAIDPSVGTDENAAVAALAGASALLSPSDDPTAFLKTILSYHIVGESLDGAEVAAANSIETLSGDTIRPNGLTLGDKDGDFADPNVTNPAGSENGVVADNGIVHVIDNVLLPYDITFSNGGFVFGGRGQDAVVGSDSFDFIVLGRGDDIANGLGGNDFIFGGRGEDLILGGAGHDFLDGGRGSDTIEGGSGNDYIDGGRGGDKIFGNEGNDKIYGGRGDDMIDGGVGNDKIDGGRGHDTIDGDEGNDVLLGFRGHDVIDGGKGDDELHGGRGQDILTGAEGDDYIAGGRGPDRFVFNPFREGEGNDVVADFNPNQDKLVLDLTTADPDVLALIAMEGEPGLQFTDFLTFDTDPEMDGIQAPVSLETSAHGDLLIVHPTGTIELKGIPGDVNPADLLPAIELMTTDDMYTS